MAQSYLPDDMERITVSSLLDDEVAYVTPWTIVADEDGRLWIRDDAGFTHEPRGTSHVRIIRTGESILVEKETMGDHRLQRQPIDPEMGMLPVVLR